MASTESFPEQHKLWEQQKENGRKHCSKETAPHKSKITPHLESVKKTCQHILLTVNLF